MVKEFTLTEQQAWNSREIRKLLDKYNKTNSCIEGTACHHSEKSQDLEAIYNSKKQNKLTAPQQLHDARKNYFTFAFGDEMYNQMETKRLEEEANKIIGDMTVEHKRAKKHINNLIQTYDVSLRHSTEQYNKLNNTKSDMDDLEMSINDDIASLKTANRKIHYENEEIKTVDMWATVLGRLYWLIFFIYAGLFLYKSLWKSKKYSAILIVLVIWPFISDWLLVKLIIIIKKVVARLPKNVYTDAENM